MPANLIWDQYAVNLELQVTGTAIAHSVITNGTITALATNHWRVAFPDRVHGTLNARRSAGERHAVLVVDDGDAAGQRTVVTIDAFKLAVQHGA